MSAALIGDIETWAAASAGASLRPSPTISTRRPCAFSASIAAIFSAGLRPPRSSLRRRARRRPARPRGAIAREDDDDRARARAAPPRLRPRRGAAPGGTRRSAVRPRMAKAIIDTSWPLSAGPRCRDAAELRGCRAAPRSPSMSARTPRPGSSIAPSIGRALARLARERGGERMMARQREPRGALQQVRRDRRPHWRRAAPAASACRSCRR